MVPLVGLQYVIVAFPGDTHVHFNEFCYRKCIIYNIFVVFWLFYIYLCICVNFGLSSN